MKQIGKLILKRSYNIATILRKVKIEIDNREFLIEANREVNVEVEVGCHRIGVKSDAFKSKYLNLEIKQGDILEINVKGRLPNVLFLGSNFVVFLILILSYFFPSCLFFFWIFLAINSSLPVYLYVFKKNDFFDIRVKKVNSDSKSA